MILTLTIKMTEQMKFIVKEINSTLGRNYDLIKFDSLDEKQLLQLLVDLLVNFKAGDKVSIHIHIPIIPICAGTMTYVSNRC